MVVYDLPLFYGRYSDLLILLLHKALKTPHLNTLTFRQAFLSILYNISPFVKNLVLQSVSALTQLVAYYISPSWLLKDADSFLPGKIILDSIVNMLSYSFSYNSVLVFGLLNQSRKYKAFMEMQLSEFVALGKKEEDEKSAQRDTFEENKEEVKILPSEQWFAENKKSLHLQQLLQILAYVSNRLDECYVSEQPTEDKILKALKRISLVGAQDDILKFAPLRFVFNAETDYWIKRYLWKTIYNRNSHLFMFIEERIRYLKELFVNNEETKEAISNVVEHEGNIELTIEEPPAKIEDSKEVKKQEDELKIERK